MVFSLGIATKAAASKRSTQRRIAKKLREAAKKDNELTLKAAPYIYIYKTAAYLSSGSIHFSYLYIYMYKINRGFAPNI